MVRMKRSKPSVRAPNHSESRPAPACRIRSIWKRRSWAWTKPRAKAASRSLAAVIVGMPCASRAMRTSAVSPGTDSRPLLSGKEERSQSSDAAIATRGRSNRRRRSHRLILPAPPRLFCRRSTQVQDDGLLLGEVLKHGFERCFLAEPRLLDAAIGHIGLHYQILVHLNEARFQALRRIERSLEVARPDRRGEAVIGVVGLTNGVLIIAELDDASHRAEDLLAANLVVVGDAGEDHRLHEIAGSELLVARHGRAAQRRGARCLLADPDVVLDLVELLLGDDAADIGRLVERIAHLHRVDLRL